MKETKLILIVAFCVFGVNLSLGQETALMASFGEGTEGKCVGSAYCTACTNCSRCGHCGSGGSCGVCSTGNRKTTKKTPSNSTTSKSNSYNLPNDTSSKYYLKRLIVNKDILNLRNGPGISYSIIEKLKMNQEITFLAMIDDWVKIKVNMTKTEGFVYYKHVLVSVE